MPDEAKTAARFPPMPLEDWAATKETLHRFLQIVGKIRLASAPRRNHWWNVPFHLTGRGSPLGRWASIRSSPSTSTSSTIDCW